MHRFAALALSGLCLAGCATAQPTSVERPDPVEVQWDRLAVELEDPPIYASSLIWEPLYRRMVELGTDPAQARRNLRRAARIGPGQAATQALVEEAKDPLDLQDALDLAFAEARDARRAAARDEVSGYVHAPPAGPILHEWNQTAGEIERFPIFASSINWEPYYTDLVEIGLSPQRAGFHVRRCTRLGLGKELLGKLIDAHRGAPDALDDALAVRYDALQADYDAGGYGFMVADKEGLEQGPKIASITGQGDAPVDSTAPGESASDDRLEDIERLTARLEEGPPPASLSGVGDGLRELLGEGGGEVKVSAVSAAHLRQLERQGLALPVDAYVEGLTAGVQQGGGTTVAVVLQFESPAAASRALAAEEDFSRRADDSGTLTAPDGSAVTIVESSYADSQLYASGYVVDKQLASGGRTVTVRSMVVASGAFLLELTEIAPPHGLEQTRSLAERALALLP